jgi:hypothetical protein
MGMEEKVNKFCNPELLFVPRYLEVGIHNQLYCSTLRSVATFVSAIHKFIHTLYLVLGM